MATEHNLYKNMGDIDVCTEFEMLKVKVPISFLGMVGFSPLGRDVSFLSFIALYQSMYDCPDRCLVSNWPRVLAILGH